MRFYAWHLPLTKAKVGHCCYAALEEGGGGGGGWVGRECYKILGDHERSLNKAALF